jgi:hypothetical protein
MSTIRATYVQHGSSAVPNITLNASGQVIVASGIVSSGTFAAPTGSAAAPGVYFVGDTNTGLYSPGADQVAVATNGTGRLFVDASGSISTSSTAWQGGSAYQLGGLQIGASTYAKALLQTGGTSRAEWLFDSADNYLLAKSGSFYIFNTTANPITFATNGSERLRISSTGLVGIGTSSPGALLDINGSGNIVRLGDGTNTIDVRFKGPNNWATQLDTSADKFNIQRNSTPLVIVDSAGRVGIGTTSPASVLNIVGTTTFNNTEISGGYNTLEIIPATTIGSSVNRIVTINTTGLSFETAGSERARIDTSGRLLVGTSSTVDSASNALLQSSASGGAFLALGNTNTVGAGAATLGQVGFYGYQGAYVLSASITANSDATWSSNDYPTRLVFSTTADGASSPTERMRINSTGNTLFGCTSLPGSTVRGIQIPSDLNTQAFIVSAGTATTTFNMMLFYNGNGLVGSITTNASATAYNTSSDYRLKENVTPVSDGITRLQQLKPSRFNFIADPDTVVDGFLAHEAQAVVPECVTGTKDEVDDDGNPVYQGIDQSKLVPLLTAALQEAIGEIESLKARVAALESA